MTTLRDRQLNKKLSQILANARRIDGLSQIELARRLGVSQSQISKYENGDREISVAFLIIWSKEIGVDIHEILERLREEVANET